MLQEDFDFFPEFAAQGLKGLVANPVRSGSGLLGDDRDKPLFYVIKAQGAKLAETKTDRSVSQDD